MILRLSVLLAAATAVFAEEPPLLPAADEIVERTPLQTVAPVYPRRARRDRIEGEVQVCFHIDREGRPYRIAVRRSTHRIFEKPARRAVRESRFAPLKKGDKHSGIKNCRTFRFRLDAVQETGQTRD